MICTEAGELMQRQLDNDLDEQELEQLMTHLSECKNCQGLFERLTLLSGSLEQLPKVIPSINIVDSILPDLEVIDRQRHNQLIMKRKKMKTWVTSISSIAAAAVVILIMSTLSNNGINSNNSSVAHDIAISDTRIIEPMDITSTSQSTERSDNREHITQDNVKEIDQLSIEPLSSPIFSAPPEAVIDVITRDQNRNVENETEMKSSSTPEKSTPTSKTERVNNEEEAPVSTDHGSFETKTKNDSNGNDEAAMSGGLSVDLDDGTPGDSDKEILEIASVNPMDEKYFSPDESVYIRFQENIILLYETSTDQLIQNWVIEGYGTLRFITWDLEGKSFIYELITADDEVSSHTIQLNESN